MPESTAETTSYEVYTDGSYLNGKVTYAFIILRDGEPVHEAGGIVPPSFAHSRQVGGEIYAVLTALEWFESNGVECASVHYDFENLALWVRGVYKANTEISRALVDRVRSSSVKLHWRKVRAHTGVHWNERVDQLAKRAALSPSKPDSAPSTVPSTPGARASESPTSESRRSGRDPLIDELESIVEPFQSAVAATGIDTRYVGILNNMYARLEVLDPDGKRVALFDLYNTAKKRLNPVVSPASSPAAARVLEIWRQFRSARRF